MKSKFKDAFLNDISEGMLRKLESIQLMRIALIKSFWKVTDGCMDEEELKYVKDAELDARFKLACMYTSEADEFFSEHEKEILWNAELYL